MSKVRWSRRATLVAALLGLGVAGGALAQPAPKHVRGTLSSVGAHEIAVQTASGKTQAVAMNDATGVYLVAPSSFDAIAPDRFVGITSVEQGGQHVAREVHVFADSLRGLGEGHYPWDLGDDPNMMTNANIGKVEQVGGDRVLRLDYKDGKQTIAVPPNTPVVSFDKSTADQLVAGRKVFVIAKPQDGGTLLAAIVVVGANGLKPPM